MRVLSSAIFAASAAMASLCAGAADFDGSKPLVCAVSETASCPSGAACKVGSAKTINLPTFIDVDFKDRLLSARPRAKPNEQGARHTNIRNFESTNGMTILQGTQNGRGWSMTINQTDGQMVLTASGDGNGFVVHGNCTPS